MTARGRLRILSLAPFPPGSGAVHGGARAIAQLLSRVADRHDVGLICLRARGEDPVEEALAAKLAFVRTIDRPTGPGVGSGGQRRRLRLLGRSLRGTPLWAAKHRSRRLTDQLRTDLSAWDPHVVEAHMHLMGQYLSEVDGGRTGRLYIVHEPGAVNARSEASRGGWLNRLLGRREARLWDRYERRVLDASDAAVVFTERDRDAVQRLSRDTPVLAIPLGIDTPPEPADPRGSEPPRILFVGNFSHAPNVDAAVRLATAILPRARSENPRIRLELVGADPPRSVQALEGDGVEVTGRVASVEPYLEHCTVVAIPLRQGGGMRIKVLEALAAGKAVVASPLALEAVGVPHGEAVLVAETDEEFAEALVALVRDPERRVALASTARIWAVENVGWDGPVERFDALYRTLVRHDTSPSVTPRRPA